MDTEEAVDGYSQYESLKLEGMLNHVLIVEDSKIVRFVMKNQLAALGIDVDIAVDGEEGFEMLLTNTYDLVLLDIELPKMNGYEMVNKLNQQGITPIVIAMTATDYDVTLDELHDIGIKGLLLKPVDLKQLAASYAAIINLY